MQQRIERLMKIDAYLREHHQTRQSCLAEVLEVSERTIRDDLHFLRDRLEAPLVWNHQRGWYYSDPQWSLPTMPLSSGEMLALILGAGLLESYTGTALQSTLQTALERLQHRLPDRVQIDLQSLANYRVRAHPGAALQIDPQVWQQLNEAIAGNQSIEIDYAAPKSPTITRRRIDPYGLFLRRGNPCVVGFCHLRQSLRDFRIDRIRQLQKQDQHFQIPPEFDLDSYLAEPFIYSQGGKPVQIEVRFAPAAAPYIAERHWHRSQELEWEADGWLRFRVQAHDLREVLRWLLPYGSDAQAIAPPELVTLVRQEISAMKQLYSAR